MNKLVAGIVGVFGLIGSTQAALGPVVNGQVYDDVLGISWLQDANVFKTLCDASDPLATGFTPVDSASAAAICANNGRMTWNDAEAWIARLNANNYLGVNTWRQWAVPDPTNDTTCSLQNGGASGSDAGYNCTASELGHLFNVTLGNPDDGDDNCYNPPGTDPDHCLQNKWPFNNVQSYRYWSGTEYAPDPSTAWIFETVNGFQLPNDKARGNGFVWPVRPGQAAAPSAVPTLSMWGLGLMGLLLAGLARRRLR